MAWSFSDSFDCYATTADLINTGYWDNGGVIGGSSLLIAGRFAGSQALHWQNAGSSVTKTSGVNDAVHHFVFAFRQTNPVTGTTLGAYFQLFDGTTAQCSVVFRSDGAILLTSGGPGGTVLATYSGAFPLVNTWYAFEVEVVVSNSAGWMKVRKNGNPTEDFTSSLTLDTQVSANAYANKLQFGMNTAFPHEFDDLYWRSDASSVAWMGDIRAIARAPASDASVQFSRTPSTVSVSQISTPSTTASKAANAGTMSAFVASYTGTISSGTISVATGGTGNMKAAIYDATRSNPLATSNAVVNPVTGSNVITFGTPLAVTRGTTYYLAVDQDTTIVYNVTGSSANQGTFTTTYASFPAINPTVTVSGSGVVGTVNIGPSFNYETVNEAQQDATTSYVYDSVPGHADLYGIAAIASTPLTTFAVTTRAYMIKSDAGTRTAAVQLKSGATTDASPTVVLTPSNWQWAWKHYTSDPDGGAWTAAAVNVAQVGPTVIA